MARRELDEHHLFNAAPDLLEALREMLAVSLRVDDLAWADAVGKGKGLGPCDWARQAIAKAQGKVVEWNSPPCAGADGRCGQPSVGILKGEDGTIRNVCEFHAQEEVE